MKKIVLIGVVRDASYYYISVIEKIKIIKFLD